VALRVLFIGGTGIISAACAREAVAAGIDLTVLNRGRTSTRPLPDGVRQVLGDVNACADGAALRDLLDGAGPDAAGPDGAGGSGGSAGFDAVVDFVAFTPDQVARDVEAFTGRVGQYVFVSSASAYQTPPLRWPITESTPLRNPYWGYSRDKIACEQLLTEAYRDSGFPAVLLRPSHTYDATAIPLTGGWTEIERMRRGAPVVVHGDGTSLWTLTHARDVASALVGMLGRPSLAGQAVHVTSDEVMTWDQISRDLAAAAGAPDPRIVHVTSDEIASARPEWAEGILGDKAHSLVFDNSLVKRIVPGWSAPTSWAAGAREIVAWHDADPARRAIDAGVDAVLDRLAARAG